MRRRLLATAGAIILLAQSGIAWGQSRALTRQESLLAEELTQVAISEQGNTRRQFNQRLADKERVIDNTRAELRRARQQLGTATADRAAAQRRVQELEEEVGRLTLEYNQERAAKDARFAAERQSFIDNISGLLTEGDPEIRRSGRRWLCTRRATRRRFNASAL